MTTSDVIKAFDTITPRKCFPPNANYQVIDATPGSGDFDWGGHLVVRVADVLRACGDLVRQLDRENGTLTMRDRRDDTIITMPPIKGKRR